MTNEEMAQALRDLRDFLIIAGYEETHVTRYTHIARHIERMNEPVLKMRREGRLKEIPGVGPLIQTYIKEILEDGVCSKQRDWESQAPWSVVEMVRVPGLGARTVKHIFNATGVKSLAELKAAEKAGALDHIEGVGSALKEAIRDYEPVV